MRNAKAHIPPIAYHGPEDSMATQSAAASIPTRINKRTKEGDRVFDGMAVFRVLHRIGDALVLRREDDPKDYHYYVRNIGGGGKRFLSYQDAINAAALPVVAAQVAIARASYGAE